MTSTTAIKPVLVFVDDEPDIAEIARMCFALDGWTILTADNVTCAKELIQTHHVDALLTDIMMRGSNGLDLLDWVRETRGSEFVVYLLTGCVDECVALARAKGANGVFAKPSNWADIVKTLNAAVLKPQLKS